MSIRWTQLLKLHCNPPTFPLGRSSKIQRKYDQHKKTANPQEFLNRLFPKDSFDLYRVIPNDFPYNVNKNILHYVLWFNPNIKYSKKIIDNHLVNNILKNQLTDKKFIYFQNLTNNSSINNITHYQVFIKRK